MSDGNKKNPKENADVPPVLPEEQQSSSDGSGVLSPEDLDLSDNPYVAELSEDRYVVSPNKSPPNVSQETSPEPRSRSSERATRESEIRSPEAARTVLADELERLEARYAVDLISRFDGNTVRHRTASDDVVGTFDNLVLWYAQSVSNNTPTTQAISLLLEKSEFSAPLTEQRLRAEIGKHGLDESSTIGELLACLE